MQLFCWAVKISSTSANYSHILLTLSVIIIQYCHIYHSIIMEPFCIMSNVSFWMQTFDFHTSEGWRLEIEGIYINQTAVQCGKPNDLMKYEMRNTCEIATKQELSPYPHKHREKSQQFFRLKFLKRWKCAQVMKWTVSVVGLCFVTSVRYASAVCLLQPLNSSSPPLQDHNSSLISQFLHDGTGPDTIPAFPTRRFSAFTPHFFSNLSAFILFPQTPFFPPISLPLISFSLLLFPCLPFTLSFPVTLCFCWGCLFTFISS